MSDTSITRRQFIAGTAAAALTLPFINLENAFAGEQRPNFVFILTDDQRWNAMSCAGHPFLKTPGMDRIAREGAMFKNAFVTISLCSPSRSCYLTGQYAHRTGILNNKTALSDSLMTFPHLLQKTGYDTAYMGKWHMDGQQGPRPGFNHWVSFKGQGVYQNETYNIDGVTVETTGYKTDQLTNYAVDWLKQPRTSPFCLYLAHKAVHVPFTPTIRHLKLYEKDEWPVPQNGLRDEKGNLIPFTEKQQENYRQYFRTLKAVDDSVETILKTLEQTGALDNTVVVFASDNGFFLGDHGLGDKRYMYEESIRIPLLIRYPKLIKPGTVIDQMALNIDICPTFLDLAGVSIPKDVQGKSLRPLLPGKRVKNWRDEWFHEYVEEPPFPAPTIRGVRTERYKYIEYPEDDRPEELFDLVNDPYEMRNLVDDKASGPILKDMQARLKRLMAETK